MNNVNSFEDISKIFTAKPAGDQEIKRGDVYYIAALQSEKDGCVQQGGRPGIVIGNNAGNLHSSVVIVVYTTTQRKTSLPTHVAINSLSEISTALCEQIVTVSKSRLCEFMGRLTVEEMKEVDKALRISIALSQNPQPSENVGIPFFECGEDKLLQEAQKKVICISETANRINRTNSALRTVGESEGICFVGIERIELDSILLPCEIREIKTTAINQITKRKKAEEEKLKELIGCLSSVSEKTPDKSRKSNIKTRDTPPTKRLTQNAKERVEQLYKGGKEMEEIMLETGIDIVRISQYIKESGLGDERHKGESIPSKGSAMIPAVGTFRR